MVIFLIGLNIINWIIILCNKNKEKSKIRNNKNKNYEEDYYNVDYITFICMC